jgi:predicted nucleotidyltransferase
MPDESLIEKALAAAARDLTTTGKRFALVGGLAVSVRAEVRFTRDVDFAVAVADDADAEALVFALRAREYRPVASVEHDTLKRLATIRLLSPAGVKIDLLFASSGIEHETVERATVVSLPVVGDIPIARAEELLAMKVLSMTDRRLQDRMDAQQLLAFNPQLDLPAVRDNLQLIRRRGFDRGEDLEAKLESLLTAHRPT